MARQLSSGDAMILTKMPSNVFMDHIRSFHVNPGSIAIWTLGQNGFLLKSPEGTVVAVDPYLTDHCTSLNAEYGLDFGRILPVFVEPEDLDVDLVLLTHSHLDHTDPETIRRFTRKDEARFFAPWQACRGLPCLGVPSDRAEMIHPLETREFRDLRITGTWSLPTDDSDLNHMGFVVEFANGLKFHNTGDTAFHDLLGHVQKMEPQIMSLCINGGFNNLDPWDGARIVGYVRPDVVIPAHFDMMVCNQQDPAMFDNALKAQRVPSKYVRLNYYEPYVYNQ
jgi:L-ascorbate 6-phosphate lactonase